MLIDCIEIQDIKQSQDAREKDSAAGAWEKEAKEPGSIISFYDKRSENK